MDGLWIDYPLTSKDHPKHKNAAVVLQRDLANAVADSARATRLPIPTGRCASVETKCIFMHLHALQHTQNKPQTSSHAYNLEVVPKQPTGSV